MFHKLRDLKTSEIDSGGMYSIQHKQITALGIYKSPAAASLIFKRTNMIPRHSAALLWPVYLRLKLPPLDRHEVGYNTDKLVTHPYLII